MILVFLFSSSTFAQLENYTYILSQSNASYEFWTTLPSEKVFKDTSVPTSRGSGIEIYAARNEYEPFQLIIKPASTGYVTINIGEFGSGIITELYQVKYVNVTTVSDYLGRTGDYPDPLWPLENGEGINLIAGENTALWINIFIPKNVSSGLYNTMVSVDGNNIPVSLHVFNFTLSDTLHIKSMMNFSYQNILTTYSVPGTGTEFWIYVNMMKQFFKDHRLTPQYVLWPGGLTTSEAGPLIDYNCAGNFTDAYGVWGFEIPAQWYVEGDVMRNNVGFPFFMGVTSISTDASMDPRPGNFCGQTRSTSDWYTGNNPSSPYNQKWFGYITALQNYLQNLNYLDKAFYYFANEPIDQEDFNAVAWYSQCLKQAAPDLKLMISEGPTAEIFDHPIYTGSKIDIWMPVLNQYDPLISSNRELNYGETTWIYFLESTRPPFFNPITLDHPGIESKLTGWFLWKYRIKGISYYSTNAWSQNPWTNPMTYYQNGEGFMIYPPSENNISISYGSNNHRFVPSIRFELMRDSFEDYEYLYLLNENKQPEINVTTSADSQVNKIISGLASYDRNSQFMYNLRKLIGQKIGGEISAIPDIQTPVTHPRSLGEPGNYYINFQDPLGQPYTTYTEDTYGNGYIYRYVTYVGHDYLQIGTEQYNDTSGFGWRDDVSHFLTGRSSGETDERKITYVYDDYAQHPNIFEFDLPNGKYNVEVSVGAPQVITSHNRVVIEGVTFIDDETANNHIIRLAEVTVNDRKLTVDVGIWNEYTLLNYLDIEAVINSIGSSRENIPEKYMLDQNYPNPFNSTTTIEFALPKTELVSLQVFNILGQQVTTLVSEKLNPGVHKFEWQADNLPSGIYYCRIQVNEFEQVRKMILLR